jgi:hypothetical protein
MSNTSYITETRRGTRAGVAEGSVRICVTLKEATFNALRDRAAGCGHTLSGEAALLIEKGLPALTQAERVA